MEKKEYLDMFFHLKQWVDWRRSHPEVIPNLSAVHFYEDEVPTYLHNINFGWTRWEKMVLSGHEFQGAFLQYATFLRCSLVETSFQNADLRHADFCGLICSGVDISHANAQEILFVGTHLNDSECVGVDLYRANLRRASVNAANLSDANLREADACYSHFVGANVRGADLIDIDLRYADVREMNILETMSGTDLTGMKLRGAKFGNSFGTTDLRGANLRSADLQDVNLTSVDLRYADLRGADLRGATFYRTLVMDAQFEDASLEDELLLFHEGMLSSREMLANEQNSDENDE